MLIPFLEKGSTAALLPITAAGELLAELTILSLDPAEPIDAEFASDHFGVVADLRAAETDKPPLPSS